MKKLSKIFKMGSTQEKNFTYVGYDITQTAEGITVSQSQFVAEKVVLFNITAERKKEPEAILDEGEITLLTQEFEQ